MPGRGRGKEWRVQSEGAFEADAAESGRRTYRRGWLSRHTKDDADAEAQSSDARHDASNRQLPGCQLVRSATARRVAQAGRRRIGHVAAVGCEASAVFVRLGAVDGAEDEEADAGGEGDAPAHHEGEGSPASSRACIRGLSADDRAAAARRADVARRTGSAAASAVARIRLDVDALATADALWGAAQHERRSRGLLRSRRLADELAERHDAGVDDFATDPARHACPSHDGVEFS